MSHFGLKVPKSQAVEKTPYTAYYPHHHPPEQRPAIGSYWQWGAIDPGLHHLGVRIERRHRTGLKETLVMENFAVEKLIEEEGTTIQLTYDTITSVLDSMFSHLINCDYILVERQLPQNHKVVRVSQHILSYLLLKLVDTHRLPVILEISPKLKGKMLGAPKGISESKLKKWSVEHAISLLTERGDQKGLQIISKAKKKDEFGDTVCMIEAMVTLWKLEG